MTKKLFSPLIGVIVLAFLFSITMSYPLLAQEAQKEEDIEDFSLEDLLNVEITTAGKQAEKISEIPASVVVVSRNDIEKYGYQTLLEILENIPGLVVTDDYWNVSLGVRGFWTLDPQRNVIVMVNGIKQTDYLTFSHYIQQLNIPVEAIDRIEVVRGPMSVIYGSGAFFGAINIITNQVAEGKGESQLSLSYGTENTLKMALRYAGKQGDLEYSFNAGYLNTDGIDVPFANMGDMALLQALGASPNQTTEGLLGNEEKYFNFSGKFNGFSVNTSYTIAERGNMLILPSIADGTKTFNSSVRANFGYEHQFSEKVRMDAGLTYFQNEMRFDYRWLFPTLFGVQTNEGKGFSADVTLFIDPTPKLNITVGVDYLKVLNIRDDFSVPALGLNYIESYLVEPMVNQSIFAQINYKFSEKFKVVVGARVEQAPEYIVGRRFGDPVTGSFSTVQNEYDFTTAQFIPRVALIYSPNEKHVFKFLFGEAINRPSNFQILDNSFFGSDLPIVEPETITTLELNYTGHLSSRFSLSLSLFRNMLDKLIYRSLSVLGGAPVSYWSNVGEVTTNGGEVTIIYRPNESFHIELSGTYQDSEDQRSGFENIELGYSPKFLGYLKASYFFNKDISLAVTGSYVDKMESYYDFTTSARQGESVDSYFLLGANLRIRNLFGKGFFLNLRGSNLLDEEIHYPTTTYTTPHFPKGTIGRGLSFLATLGWKF